jgi:hypothetical protein
MQVSHEIVNKAHSASQTKQSISSSTMEHLNRIELVGTLWSIYVNGFSTAKVGTLVIVTECEHFAQDGCKTIETTCYSNR